MGFQSSAVPVPLATAVSLPLADGETALHGLSDGVSRQLTQLPIPSNSAPFLFPHTKAWLLAPTWVFLIIARSKPIIKSLAFAHLQEVTRLQRGIEHPAQASETLQCPQLPEYDSGAHVHRCHRQCC